ncbi:hypothetical protein C8R41DRAFT_860449 [Lentinula lateritia]|uniref:Uncharacterized protein n=1 Tax=Lentinula lateritia TaxID=40482 RepID=A0ABQ8UWU8_9AGAR|nr:hypothetical protein C8R41DRAFT_860449 [Lentinula lateritia]
MRIASPASTLLAQIEKEPSSIFDNQYNSIPSGGINKFPLGGKEGSFGERPVRSTLRDSYESPTVTVSLKVLTGNVPIKSWNVYDPRTVSALAIRDPLPSVVHFPLR